MARSEGETGDEPAIGRSTAAAVDAAQAHARDLVDAAKAVADRFPHLAYHFAVLALEEIGRGVLLVIRASARETESETRALDDAMEDHVQKLFWALWSPSRADWISGGQIDEFRELARAIHEQRKSGLYFDPAAAAPPREAVTQDETKMVIGLAEARLGMETAKNWAPVGSEQAENVRFFGEAVSDNRTRDFVFSGGSLKKLAELRDVPNWIAWLREQLQEAERHAREAAERELARTAPSGDAAAEEKWSMELRIFSESHSIRQSALNTWNDGVDWIKLRRAEAHQLIVRFTLPRAVLATSLWGTTYSLAQQLLLALNIGTVGFFWWRRRDDLARFYDELLDLERDEEVVVERSPPLSVDWGSRHVLNGTALSRVMTCFAMLPRDPNDPAAQALGHYLRGLALIAKTDVHIQFNQNIFHEFHLALRGGMQAYGAWDGESPFGDRFAEFADRFFKGDEDRDHFIAAAQLCEDGRVVNITLPFEKVIMMKALADAFFLEKFHDLSAKREEHERAHGIGEGGADG
jgi:AbiV family abortive infection protein